MKLDIGAGLERDQGWTTLDIDEKANPDLLDDATILGTIPDRSCEQIRAAHLLEHLYHFQIIPTLELWYRKLKAGGILTLYLPDIFTEIERFLLREEQPDRFFAIVYGKQWSENPAALHKTAFWPERIEGLLLCAGFEDVQSTPPRWDTEFAIQATRKQVLYKSEET